MNLSLDKSTLSTTFENPLLIGTQDYLSRGGIIRCITEITPENTQKCKKLLNLDYEIRHIDDLKCVIAVSDLEYMAATVLDKGQPMTETIVIRVMWLCKECICLKHYGVDLFLL